MAIDVNIPSQVKNYANLAAFPATGTLKTIFIAEDTNKTYRWTGSAYVEISATAASTWGAIGGTLSNQTDLQNALNAKQDTLVSATNIKTINGNTLLGSGDLVVGGSSAIAIGTTAITSGTVGRVLFEGTGNVVQESANLFWDNTNGRLGIGGTPSTFNLDVVGTARVQGNTTISLNQNGVTLINASNTTSGTASTAELRATTGGGFIGLGKYSASTNSYKFIASSDSYLYSATIGDIAIINDFASGRIKFGAGASSTAQATLFSTGNFAINTTTDAGFKLDVNGTARVQDNLTVSKNQNASTILTISNTTSGASAQIALLFNANTGIYKYSASTTTYKIFNANDFGHYNSAAGDISILNDFNTGKIKFSAGGSSTAQMTLASTGNLLINTTTDVASSKLTIESTTQGFLPPRMTTTQKNAIASPATGLVVYDTTLNKLCLRTASAWETITSL